jgi:hypothetical protein
MPVSTPINVRLDHNREISCRQPRIARETGKLAACKPAGRIIGIEQSAIVVDNQSSSGIGITADTTAAHAKAGGYFVTIDKIGTEHLYSYRPNLNRPKIILPLDYS